MGNLPAHTTLDFDGLHINLKQIHRQGFGLTDLSPVVIVSSARGLTLAPGRAGY
jgi:hypothetical protein